MTMLKRIVVALVVTSLLATASFAQQGPQGNGDADRVQQKDGTGDQQADRTNDQDRLQDGSGDNVTPDCDGTGPQQPAAGQGQGRGGGNGRGGQMPWRAAQQNRQAQEALAMGPITEAEAAHVLYMRQEEKLARDVYITLDGLWLADIFENIAVSEQRHMGAVARIIEAQELVDSAADDTVGVFADEVFSELYLSLIERGTTSYAEALKVGAYIEELDIIDLLATLEDVENEYVIRVFQNLLRGSRNHLRAFVRELEGEGETYSLQLMSQELYDEIINGPIERAIGNGNSNNQGANTNR